MSDWNFKELSQRTETVDGKVYRIYTVEIPLTIELVHDYILDSPSLMKEEAYRIIGKPVLDCIELDIKRGMKKCV